MFIEMELRLKMVLMNGLFHLMGIKFILALAGVEDMCRMKR